MYKYIILIFLFSCSLVKQNENKEDQIIARVGDKFLLRDEILYQKSMGDSVSVFSNQINDWLKKQLLLKSAYQSDELRLLIDRKVEKYRDDLLLFEFEKLMLISNPSQEVSLIELENYYDENIDDFISIGGKLTLIKIFSNKKTSLYLLLSFFLRFLKPYSIIRKFLMFLNFSK